MKHAKQRTHARLQRRRRKVAEEKVAKVLQEVRAEIQRANMKKRQRSHDPPQGGVRTSANHEAEGKHGDEQVLGQGKGKATEQNEYDLGGHLDSENVFEVRLAKWTQKTRCVRENRVWT